MDIGNYHKNMGHGLFIDFQYQSIVIESINVDYYRLLSIIDFIDLTGWILFVPCLGPGTPPSP